MASLGKKNERYYARVWVGGKQKWFPLKTKNYRIAKERLKKYDASEELGVLREPTKTALSEILPQYVSHLKAQCSTNSISAEISYLRQFFGEHHEALQPGAPRGAEKSKSAFRKRRKGSAKADYVTCLEQVTPGMLQAFIDDRIYKDGVKPKTAQRLRGALHAFFNWARKYAGYRSPSPEWTNPVAETRTVNVPVGTPRFLTLKQIEEQLNALTESPQLQVMVAVLIFAGLRREELVMLTKSDVDLDQGRLHIRAKELDGVKWQPKTKRERIIPISTSLQRYLNTYAPLDDCEWFFPSPEGVRWDVNNFGHTLSRIQKALGLQWTCLDFRHSFGSQLARAGVSLYKISKLMGNSPDICRRHYACLAPEELTAEVEFMTAEKPPSKPARSRRSGNAGSNIVRLEDVKKISG